MDTSLTLYGILNIQDMIVILKLIVLALFKFTDNIFLGNPNYSGKIDCKSLKCFAVFWFYLRRLSISFDFLHLPIAILWYLNGDWCIDFIWCMNLFHSSCRNMTTVTPISLSLLCNGDSISRNVYQVMSLRLLFNGGLISRNVSQVCFFFFYFT